MAETLGVAQTFGIVLFAVVAAAALVAVVTAVTSGRSWDQIGRGGLSLRDGGDGSGDDAPAGATAAAGEREDEIRQMLEARNELRRRHGRETVDVEAELRALDRAAAVPDPELEAEVRALVIARNERRARQGREPLDVDAEVARRLRDLTGGHDA
jgi:hypothetical protein